MTPAGLTLALRAFAARRPFQSFLIELHSGDRVRVNHPEAATIVGDVVVYKSPRNQYRLFDSTSVCQLLDIESPTVAAGS